MKRWNRRYETNIKRLIAHASEDDIVRGTNWYSDANSLARQMAERYSLSLAKVVGVIAVLSPGSEWNRNIIDAEMLIKSFIGHQTIPTVGVYGKRNIAKAVAILEGARFEDVVDSFNSPKVHAFYHAILNPTTATEVVVDQHMKAVMLHKRGKRGGSAWNEINGVQRHEYPYLAWHIRKIAERAEMSPVSLQAILWLTWKRLSTVQGVA